MFIFYEDNSLNYWEATLSDRSREFKDCSWWEIWQIQAIQKNTTTKQSIKSSLALAELENQNLEILERAKKLKNSNQETKKNRIGQIKRNRSAERAKERDAIKQEVIRKKISELKLVNANTNEQQNSEELALDNPIYSNLLYEDE